MTTSPEATRPSPQEPPKVESARDIFNRIYGATKSIVQDPLNPEQTGQAVRTVLDGVTALHRQGQLGPVRDTLQTHVFTPDPARKIIADTLVADIEQSNTGRYPRGVQFLLELASALGISDPAKFPDLSERLGAIKVKEKRPARPSRPKSKEGEATARPGQGRGEYDFIPHADKSQPEVVDQSDDLTAFAIGFGEVVGYLPNTPDNVKMMEGIEKGDQPALIRLIKMAAARGYSDRIVRRITSVFTRDPKGRAEEVIPILEAFPIADPTNSEAYQLLGDAYLQLGMHREAIGAYREKLKLPPKE